MARERAIWMQSAFAMFFGLCTSCVIDASVEQKRCPCGEGFVCDAVSNTCVLDACAVSAKGFESLWATSHFLAFDWSPAGSEDAFLRYEVTVAESEADVASRSGTARVLTRDTNPELGSFNSGTEVPVVNVLVGGLEPATVYYADLVAVDTQQCASQSAIVARATLPAPIDDPLALFDDALPAGATLLPAALHLASDATATWLEYVAADDVGCQEPDGTQKATCGQPLKMQDFAVDVSADPSNPAANKINVETFAQSFLELRLLHDSPIAGKWSGVWLHSNGCQGDDYRFDNFTLPRGPEYFLLEVPLHALHRDGVALSYADLDTHANGTPICGFGLTSQWHESAVVRIDSIRIQH